MAALNENQVKVLEQTRHRLLQLTHSLGSLATSINQNDPLPSWSSLQSQANIISNNLNTISSQLSEHHELLSSLVAYPGPSFPSRTQSGVLEQLLRTKLDPRVEDWVARGRSAGATALIKEQDGLSEEELAELWAWAPIEANQEARRRNWGGNFTLEERAMGIQNVVTGLKRQLEDEESEEESEEEEEEEDADEMEIVDSQGRLEGPGVEDGQRIPSKPTEPALPLDEIFRFMSTGTNPKSATSS